MFAKGQRLSEFKHDQIDTKYERTETQPLSFLTGTGPISGRLHLFIVHSMFIYNSNKKATKDDK